MLIQHLTDPHPGLHELYELNLGSTAKQRGCSISSASYRATSYQSYGTWIYQVTLTDCLSGFPSDPHPGLPELEELYLEDTALNKEDLQHLSHITKCNKLPKLQIFGSIRKYSYRMFIQLPTQLT